MSVSFRRVRDMAIMTRDSECIAILAQTLRAAVEMEDSVGDLGLRIDALFRQLEEEYAVCDVRSMIAKLSHDYELDASSCSATLKWFHQLNMGKHEQSLVE
ncbi:hypothetical protein B0H13DRAFT_2303690 [Mycena leptocephala]|nr:hypothetical protein B0H13DRAFT_2303690 [Mycena leptocephala]